MSTAKKKRSRGTTRGRVDRLVDDKNQPRKRRKHLTRLRTSSSSSSSLVLFSLSLSLPSSIFLYPDTQICPSICLGTCTSVYLSTSTYGLSRQSLHVSFPALSVSVCISTSLYLSLSLSVSSIHPIHPPPSQSPPVTYPPLSSPLFHCLSVSLSLSLCLSLSPVESVYRFTRRLPLRELSVLLPGEPLSLFLRLSCSRPSFLPEIDKIRERPHVPTRDVDLRETRLHACDACTTGQKKPPWKPKKASSSFAFFFLFSAASCALRLGGPAFLSAFSVCLFCFFFVFLLTRKSRRRTRK